jgi:hypothetical protein
MHGGGLETDMVSTDFRICKTKFLGLLPHRKER